MDKLIETALANAAYQREFERLQELVPALQNAPGMEDQWRTHSSKVGGPAEFPLLACFKRFSMTLTFPPGWRAQFKAGRLQSGSGVREVPGLASILGSINFSAFNRFRLKAGRSSIPSGREILSGAFRSYGKVHFRAHPTIRSAVDHQVFRAR